MTEITPITASFVWTFDGFTAMQKASASNPTKLKPSTWVINIIAIVVVFVAAIRYVSKEKWFLFGEFALVFLIFGLFYYFAQKQSLKRSFLALPEANKRIDVTFTLDTVVMKASNVYETKWNWGCFREIRRTPKGFLFFHSPQNSFWIPLQAFQSTAGMEAVSELAGRLTPKFTIIND